MRKGHRNVNSPLSVAYDNCVQIKWVFITNGVARHLKATLVTQATTRTSFPCVLWRTRNTSEQRDLSARDRLITRLNESQSNYETPIMDVILVQLNQSLVVAYRIINVRDPSGIGTT